MKKTMNTATKTATKAAADSLKLSTKAGISAKRAEEAKAAEAEAREALNEARAAKAEADKSGSEAAKAEADKKLKAAAEDYTAAKTAKAEAEAKAEAKAEEAAKAEAEAREAVEAEARERVKRALAEKTEAEKTRAAKAAAAAFVKKYDGKPRELLAARTIVRNAKSGAVTAFDYSFSYTDYTAAAAGDRTKVARRSVSAFSSDIIGSGRAKEAKERAKLVAAEAAKVAKASVHAAAAVIVPDTEKILSIVKAEDITLKKEEIRSIVAAAFTVEKDGEDGAKASAVLSAIEAIAAKKLRGMPRREA